ncbi:MAG: cytochrome c biogenesis protein CcdA [Acidobacteria bacterium]|nr:cytochrome c biogenesis protein CcdA [Acidobacteriota bacterium]
METLFTTLTHAVSGQPAVALAAAFAWGLASLLLSPCHLASIPLVVGFVSGQGQVSTARGVSIASSFSFGLLTTIAVIGGVTAAAGRMAGDVGPWANYAVAVVFFVVGLSLLDVVPLGWASPDTSRFRGRGLTAALLLGLVFGVALGPCTFAFMAPMLGVTFAVSGTSTLYGLLLIAAYGIGHCFVIVLAGGSTSWVRRYLRWTDSSGGARALRYTSGVLVLVGGLYLIHTA